MGRLVAALGRAWTYYEATTGTRIGVIQLSSCRRYRTAENRGRRRSVRFDTEVGAHAGTRKRPVHDFGTDETDEELFDVVRVHGNDLEARIARYRRSIYAPKGDSSYTCPHYGAARVA
jgi:hypothetical protein